MVHIHTSPYEIRVVLCDLRALGRRLDNTARRGKEYLGVGVVAAVEVGDSGVSLF
jgi:hypothetical protein